MPNYISKGTEVISSGGTLFNPYVLSSGIVIALGGGVVSSANIYSGGKEYVSSGGVDYNAYVYSGGGLRVYSSGLLYNPYVNSQAGIDVWGGRVFGGVVGAKGTLEASGYSGGPKGYISAVRIISGGNMVLGQNGVGSAISVESGYLFVSSGGYLQESYVGSGTFAQTSRGAECYVDNGGLAHLTYVHSHGMFIVRSGGSATATRVYASGSAIVSSGGLLSGTSAFGGVVDVKPGGSAESTTIQKDGSRGAMYVSDGAVARNTVIDSGASMYVLSGGVAAGNVAYNTVKNGLLHVNGTAFSFDVLSGGRVEVASNGKIDTFSLNGGSITVFGIANENFYNSGKVVISGGSSISDMISGGSMDIRNRVISGSSGSSLARGYAEKLTIQDATAYLSSGGVIVSATVSSGGELFIYSSAHAGKVDVMSGGELFVKNGGYLDSASIHGSEWIASGGSADHLNVLTGGYLEVAGRTQNCKVSSDATIDVTGAFTNGSAAAGAKINVLSNGTATLVQAGGISATATKGGILEVCGTIRFGEVNGGYLTLSSGGYISGGVVSSGMLDIGSGCSGSSVQVSGFGLGVSGSARLLVAGGGKTSNGNILGSQADLQVFSNGFAGSMNIYSGASAAISGTIDTCFVSDGGKIFVSSGAVASRTTIGSGGTMTTSRGALATITIIGTGGEFVLNSGTANTVNVNGGLLTVSFGSATDCHVREGGRAVVHSLGVIAGGVEAGGTVVGVSGRFGGLTISSGGKFTGTADLRGSSQVLSFASGGIMDFDISDKSNANILIHDLNKAANVNNAVYTLTVSDTQKEATYNLADGAAGFDKTISVVNTAGTNLGTLSLGNKVKIGDFDYTLNLKGADNVLSVKVEAAAPATATAKGDIDGNGISDVLFQYSGGDYQLGYWMNGTNEWRGQGLAKPAEWEVLGSYDMNSNGNADAVLVGNVTTEIGGKGAYIGYYLDSVDTDANWQNIGYLNNEEGIVWKNKVGNLTGNEGKNSIVWYAPEMYALGVWTDGTTDWITLSNSFGGDDWTLVGCGDFDGDGKDSVVMSYNNGQMFYTVDIGGTPVSLGSANWSGWEIRAIGDFTGDGREDLVLFHNDTGSMVMCANGDLDSYVSIGQLAADDWFVVGAGDYAGDNWDDLLVRQKSTGMLGYYENGSTSPASWVELGRGVDMKWTVIA